MSDSILRREISYVEQYLEPLRDYLVDDGINELVINPNGSIFVEEAGAHHMHEVDLSLPPQAIKRLGAQLAGETRNTLGALNPTVSGRVTVWGNPQRVQIVAEPAIEHGVSLSIRKYMTKPLPPADICFVAGTQVRVNDERIRRHQAIAELAQKGDLQGLFHRAVDEKFNVLIAGGTSSGKTTVARSLISMMNQDERLITIEDAQELFPPHRNQVALISFRRLFF